jgi:hypothetical protein
LARRTVTDVLSPNHSVAKPSAQKNPCRFYPAGTLHFSFEVFLVSKNPLQKQAGCEFKLLIHRDVNQVANSWGQHGSHSSQGKVNAKRFWTRAFETTLD